MRGVRNPFASVDAFARMDKRDSYESVLSTKRFGGGPRLMGRLYILKECLGGRERRSVLKIGMVRGWLNFSIRRCWLG